MKAAQISKAGGDWELVERDITEPGPAQVRVKVEAVAEFSPRLPDRWFLTVRSRKSIKGNRDNTNGAPERV
jgi:hypothetical protein